MAGRRFRTLLVVLVLVLANSQAGWGIGGPLRFPEKITAGVVRFLEILLPEADTPTTPRPAEPVKCSGGIDPNGKPCPCSNYCA